MLLNNLLTRCYYVLYCYLEPSKELCKLSSLFQWHPLFKTETIFLPILAPEACPCFCKGVTGPIPTVEDHF